MSDKKEWGPTYISVPTRPVTPETLIHIPLLEIYEQRLMLHLSNVKNHLKYACMFAELDSYKSSGVDGNASALQLKQDSPQLSAKQMRDTALENAAKELKLFSQLYTKENLPIKEATGMEACENETKDHSDAFMYQCELVNEMYKVRDFGNVQESLALPPEELSKLVDNDPDFLQKSARMTERLCAILEKKFATAATYHARGGPPIPTVSKA